MKEEIIAVIVTRIGKTISISTKAFDSKFPGLQAFALPKVFHYTHIPGLAKHHSNHTFYIVHRANLSLLGRHCPKFCE
jgi:hypothetical protein